MIVACYVAHGEELLIAESVRSIAAYVDAIVVLDAVFPSNDAMHAMPGDPQELAVRSAAGSVPVTYTIEEQELPEVDARNGVLTLATRRDWALILDADEILVGHHDSVLELLAWTRSGNLPQARGVNIYTAAILFDGHAPDIDEAAYAQLPVVHTVGIQPRLFPVKDHQYRMGPEGDPTPALYAAGEAVGEGELLSEFLLVNERTRQSYEAYQADYRWQTG